MTDFTTLLAQGNAWLYAPMAVLLGALHGLEPGHSKTLMAGFIVAVRGTVKQAVLLGLAATVSHTAVVWAVALAGLWLGRTSSIEATEPYFQLASGAVILAVAAWMFWRLRRERSCTAHHHHDHGHDPDHRHAHDGAHGAEAVETTLGLLRLGIMEDGVPPRFQLEGCPLDADHVALHTERPDGRRTQHALRRRGDLLESVDVVPEPHAFTVHLTLRSSGGQDEAHRLQFAEPDEALDAHARAHARDIEQRFAGRSVTTGQILAFGLTGGLIPCPASITVLLLCLQLQQVTLGAALVLCFSVGLAATMVASGAIAALGVRHLPARWAGLRHFARWAPQLSIALIALTGLYMGWHGVRGLQLVA